MVERTEVVTVFLERDGAILVARRSDDVRTYRGQWAGISGYLETDVPLDQAYVEIEEETGLDRNKIKLTHSGEPLDVDDGDKHWRVHPFRFNVTTDDEIKLDREHTNYRWIKPSKLEGLETVPKLQETWDQVS